MKHKQPKPKTSPTHPEQPTASHQPQPPTETATAPHQILATCLLTQIDYLNKALDLFNTAVVSPIYYVMFTLLSITASVIMFQVGLGVVRVWSTSLSPPLKRPTKTNRNQTIYNTSTHTQPQDVQTTIQMATEVSGFITIVGGTFMLHATRDLDLTPLDLDRLTKGERGSDDGVGAPGGARGGSGSFLPSLRGRRPVMAGVEMGAGGGGGGGGGKHVALEVGGGGGAPAASREGGGATASGDREDDPLLNSNRKR